MRVPVLEQKHLITKEFYEKLSPKFGGDVWKSQVNEFWFVGQIARLNAWGTITPTESFVNRVARRHLQLLC